MSKVSQKKSPVSVLDIVARKAKGEKLSMITCYDSAFAKLINLTGIDIVLVGDSVGNVMLGFDNTIPVTVDHMIHHTAAVARVLEKSFLCADMPFFSYQVSKVQALRSAGRLIQEGGAHGVKLEGGKEVASKARAIVKAGIPVMGHLGLTPQSLYALGGYRVQGRGNKAAQKFFDDAKALEDAGCFAIVLELVPAELAQHVTAAVKVPTIGIGAGVNCDGQVLVLQDMLGMDAGFKPKFLKQYASLSEIVSGALNSFDREVKQGKFPGTEHSFMD